MQCSLPHSGGEATGIDQTNEKVYREQYQPPKFPLSFQFKSCILQSFPAILDLQSSVLCMCAKPPYLSLPVACGETRKPQAVLYIQNFLIRLDCEEVSVPS